MKTEESFGGDSDSNAKEEKLTHNEKLGHEIKNKKVTMKKEESIRHFQEPKKRQEKYMKRQKKTGRRSGMVVSQDLDRAK